MMGGDPVASREALVYSKLMLKLRIIYVKRLQLDSNFPLGRYVYPNVNKT